MKKNLLILITLLVLSFGFYAGVWADSKTSNLGETSDIQSTDLFYLVDGATSTKITAINVFDMINTPAKFETISNSGAYASDILAATSEANFKSIVNLEPGTDVQEYDADLTTWAGITPSANAQAMLLLTYAQISAALHLDDVITLTGVLEEAVHLGTFTGSTISDSVTIKAAIQALETALELTVASVPTDLTDFTEQTAWRIFYSDTNGDVTELALGAANTFLGSDGTTSAPSFQTLVDDDIPASIDPDKIGTDGTANDKIEAENINIQSMDITTVDTIVWNAGGMIASGTCTDAAEATINSGPIVHSIICTDANTSVIDGHVVMPDGWNAGTVTFEMEYIQSAADTADFLGDIKAMCRGATETVNNTWGDTVAMDDAGVTGSNAVDHLTSGAVTANGTCAAGDTLYWKWTWSDDSDTAPATLNITGMKMEFTKTLGD